MWEINCESKIYKTEEYIKATIVLPYNAKGNEGTSHGCMKTFHFPKYTFSMLTELGGKKIVSWNKTFGQQMAVKVLCNKLKNWSASECILNTIILPHLSVFLPHILCILCSVIVSAFAKPSKCSTRRLMLLFTSKNHF